MEETKIILDDFFVNKSNYYGWANFMGCFFFWFSILDLNFLITLKKNYYCDERLLVSKKVTSTINPNVKLCSNVILIVLTMTIELSIVRKKIGYYRM